MMRRKIIADIELTVDSKTARSVLYDNESIVLALDRAAKKLGAYYAVMRRACYSDMVYGPIVYEGTLVKRRGEQVAINAKACVHSRPTRPGKDLL